MTIQERLTNAITNVCEVVSILNERQRRLILASLAAGYGFGGAKLISRLAKVDQRTISSGISELKQLDDNDLNYDPKQKIRKKGGGRKSVSELEPTLLTAISEIIESSIYGNPEKILLWTNLSLRDISEELEKRYSIKAGKDVVARALEKLGYSKQANKKLIQVGTPHPGRDEIFQFINNQAKTFIAEGEPVISVDTKKNELIGNFKNEGKEYRPKQNPRPVNDHDFSLEKVSPYGIYVENDNTGFVNLGISHDTAEFAVESIRRWWYQVGVVNFPNANKLMISCDGGGSNGWRVHLWKYQLAILSEEIGIPIHVCHFPPGTSKWNKIEHRLFCYITKKWEGKPLIDIKTVINLISSTRTSKGLKVQCIEDANTYEKGIIIDDSIFKTIDIERVGPYDEFTYVIKGFLK